MASPKIDAGGDQKQDYHLEKPKIRAYTEEKYGPEM